MNRRQLLLGLLATGALSGCSGSPGSSIGFGETGSLGSLEEVRAAIQEAGGFLRLAKARAWVVEVPVEVRTPLKEAHVANLEANPPDPGVFVGPFMDALWPTESLSEAIDAGLLALFDKCPHLGCEVETCAESGQFECPCHGSMYSPYGEKVGGPSPRGMDLLGLAIIDREVVLNALPLTQGLEIGLEVSGWEPLGPSCPHEPYDP